MVVFNLKSTEPSWLISAVPETGTALEEIAFKFNGSDLIDIGAFESKEPAPVISVSPNLLSRAAARDVKSLPL